MVFQEVILSTLDDILGSFSMFLLYSSFAGQVLAGLSNISFHWSFSLKAVFIESGKKGVERVTAVSCKCHMEQFDDNKKLKSFWFSVANIESSNLVPTDFFWISPNKTCRRRQLHCSFISYVFLEYQSDSSTFGQSPEKWYFHVESPVIVNLSLPSSCHVLQLRHANTRWLKDWIADMDWSALLFSSGHSPLYTDSLILLLKPPKTSLTLFQWNKCQRS